MAQIEERLRKRILLIFDLNGTLSCLSKTRHQKGITIRPGIENLNRLFASKQFQIAIWSSATKHTVEKIREMIEENLDYQFDYVLNRDYCITAPTEENEYATKKPLSSNFPQHDIKRIILIDDKNEKIIEEEMSNLLLIPAWDKGEDSRLEKLVDLLLELKSKGDIRHDVKNISYQL